MLAENNKLRGSFISERYHRPTMMRPVLGNIVRVHICVQRDFLFETSKLFPSKIWTDPLCDFEIAGRYDRSCNEIEETINLNDCIEELHRNFGTTVTPN